MQWIKTLKSKPSENGNYVCRLIEKNGIQDIKKVEWENDSDTHLEYWDCYVSEWLDEQRLDPGFVDYMNNAKGEFVAFINKQDWNNELRTNAESFIIAYDQIAERLVKAVG